MIILRTSLLFIIISFLKSINCYNILYVNDLPSPSHHIWNYALAKGLMDRGHNITMVSPDAFKGEKSDKYHPITFEGIYEKLQAETNMEDSVEYSTLEEFFWFISLSKSYTLNIMKSKGFKFLMSYPEDFKFDLIIVDVSTAPFLLPVIQKFNYPPTIGVTPFLLAPYVSEMFGNDLQPAYLPYYHLRYDDNMNFWQRIVNYFYINLESYYQKYFFRKWIENVHKKYIGDHVDPLVKLRRHVSLVLSNIDPCFTYPQPIPPNIIPVGGLHTREPAKLPQDLQKIVDKSSKGFIIVSFGTNVRADNFKEDKRRIFLNVFSKLPETILWKYEGDLKNISANIVLRKWLPINDLLGHGKAKLFISHGGALSTQEAMFHGVPVLGIPFYADQHGNLKQMANRNLSINLDFNSLTEEQLLDAMKTLLNNPIYKSSMQEVSHQFRDMQEHPLKRAVHWVEYAIKYKGAQFLNPKSRDLPYFVSASLDVVLFLLLLTIFVFVMFYSIIKIIINIFTVKRIKNKKE